MRSAGEIKNHNEKQQLGKKKQSNEKKDEDRSSVPPSLNTNIIDARFRFFSMHTGGIKYSK